MQWDATLSLSEQKYRSINSSNIKNVLKEGCSIQERNSLISSPPSLSYGTVRPLCDIFREKKSSKCSSGNKKVLFAENNRHLSGGGLDNSADTIANNDSISRKRKIFFCTALLSFPTVCLAAKIGLLRGPVGSDGEILPYSDKIIAYDLSASLFCTVLAWVLIKVFTVAAKNGIMDSQDSRKCIHTFSSPLYMALWPFFSNSIDARFFAAIPVFLNAIRVFIAGSSTDSSKFGVLSFNFHFGKNCKYLLYIAIIFSSFLHLITHL